MPNVLLFGCDKELVKRLTEDSRWNVAIGVHKNEASPDIPDPRHWQLVIDDCFKPENEALFPEELPEIPRYDVPSRYLVEASRAHGIRLCGENVHFQISSRAPTGYMMLEFNAVLESESVEHLEDFVETFKDRFSRTYLRHEPSWLRGYGGDAPCIPIFRDIYGWPLLELHEHDFPLLCCIDMVDKDARIDALFYLCQRTVPRLWPEVYSDLFRPRRVVALEQQRSDIIGKRHKEVEEIEQKIQEELDFYAPYTNLPWVGDDELKNLVAEVFAKVFGFTVKDLDAEAKEHGSKTLDLIVRYGGWSAMVEVRSGTNRNARRPDLEKLDDNYDRARKVHGETDSKLFVFNGMYGRDPEERKEKPTFGQPVVDEAEIRGIGLLSTEQLLMAIEAYRNDEVTVDQLVEALRRRGLCIPPSEGSG